MLPGDGLYNSKRELWPPIQCQRNILNEKRCQFADAVKSTPSVLPCQIIPNLCPTQNMDGYV